MKVCMAWPGLWASVWCRGVDSMTGMNMTAVTITAIICVTIIILAWMGNKK